MWDKRDDYCSNSKCARADLKTFLQCRLDSFEMYFMVRYRLQLDCLIQRYVDYVKPFKEIEYGV